MALTQSQRGALRHPVRWLFNGEIDGPEEIPRKELTKFSLGLMGQNQLCGMAGSNWLFHFCTNVLMLDPVTVGKMIGAVSFFDALNDPVVGAMIDNYRFKDGRKLLPWIKITSPFIAVLAFLLFFNWNLPGAGARVIYCVVIYVLWDILYSFQDSALWGITAVISPSSAQRARATQWADIGALLGGLLPQLLLPMLSGNGAFGLSQQQVYLLFAAVLCLGGGFQVMTALGVTERVRALPGEEKAQGGFGSVRSLFRNLGVLRHNYVLLLFLASEVLKNCAPNVGDAYIFQQMTYKVGGSDVPAPVLMIVVGALTMLPGTLLKPFAVKIAARVGGMKRVLLIGCLAGIASRLLRFAVGIKTLPMFVLNFVIAGIEMLPGSITNIAQRAMISDSVEYVEWKTGHRTEGITMSVKNLMSKSAWSIQRYIQGLCLGFLQYNAKNVELGRPQNAHFHQWVWPIYMLGPVMGLVLQLVPLLLLKYPDSLKAQVEDEMARRRALAAEETTENSA